MIGHGAAASGDVPLALFNAVAESEEEANAAHASYRAKRQSNIELAERENGIAG